MVDRLQPAFTTTDDETQGWIVGRVLGSVFRISSYFSKVDPVTGVHSGDIAVYRKGRGVVVVDAQSSGEKDEEGYNRFTFRVSATRGMARRLQELSNLPLRSRRRVGK